MRSDASSLAEYLAEIPPERLAAIETLRSVVNANLGEGYEEGMQYGMIGWYVPHRVYPKGYHCDPKQPLPFASLASQKNHMALYLMCLHVHGGDDRRFRERWKAGGRKADFGKACIRFRKIEDLDLDLIAEAIRGVGAAEFVRHYEETLRGGRRS